MNVKLTTKLGSKLEPAKNLGGMAHAGPLESPLLRPNQPERKVLFREIIMFLRPSFLILSTSCVQPTLQPACAFHKSKSILFIIQMQKTLQTICRASKCERVMTTQAEFHFSWVYTFSATPRSLRIWATHPPRETGCDPAPPAQLCWSSSSSFPHICTTTSWKWTVTKLI